MVEVPGDPPTMVQWYGDQTRTIVSATGENSVMNVFDSVPRAQPASWDGVLPTHLEWGEGHIGRGVFLTRNNDGGENDEPGVSYSVTGAKVHLFQAVDGDTNGDRNLDGRDIQAIQAWVSFGQTGMGTGPNGEWYWTQGDFTGDHVVDGLDISAILSTGLWPTDNYAAVDRGDPGDGIVDLMLDRNSGELTLDTGQMTINGYVIRSATGIFTGEPADNLGWFVE
ncbi:MAG: hypothetical protein GY708_17305, partial [Actinomycetia bacterium]|nr:hypothetical protein [Actinomycetes bacterium]